MRGALLLLLLTASAAWAEDVRCNWTGPHYRAVGNCWVELSHVYTVVCDDVKKKPRTCQKEFDARGEDYNVEDCLSRRIDVHRQKWFETHCPHTNGGGMCWGDEDKGIAELISEDRYMAVRECSVPKKEQQ